MAVGERKAARDRNARQKRGTKVHAVDLFCGIGGLTRGLKDAGINVRAGFDIEESCKYAYEANNSGARFFRQDIRTIRASDILPFYKDAAVTVLVGCAPCQPFSAHRRKFRSDADCSLVAKFAQLVRDCAPDFVSMENVPGLAKQEEFEEFLTMLDDMKYRHDWDILSCADYGVPQKRKRLVLLASRRGDILLPQPTGKKAVVGDEIRGLPSLKDGQASPDDPAHAALPLSAINKKRIRQSKPGGSWKDWDADIVSECHKKAYYPAPYGRMRWDAPAPTITTQFCYYSTGRFGHPKQHRAISVREAAMLQTFPREYKLAPQGKSIVIRETARHIGNAVPVKLAEAIGNTIMEKANV